MHEPPPTPAFLRFSVLPLERDVIFAALLMIVILKPKTSKEQVEEVAQEVQKLGYTPHPIYGELQTVIAAIGDERTHHTLESLAAFPQVERVLPVQKRYKLVSRESKSEETVIDVDGIKIGGGNFVIMAGPCSVESEEQLISTAKAVRAHGAKILRGGAYKPRTSPYEFQGSVAKDCGYWRRQSRKPASRSSPKC